MLPEEDHSRKITLHPQRMCLEIGSVDFIVSCFKNFALELLQHLGHGNVNQSLLVPIKKHLTMNSESAKQVNLIQY